MGDPSPHTPISLLRPMAAPRGWDPASEPWGGAAKQPPKVPIHPNSHPPRTVHATRIRRSQRNPTPLVPGVGVLARAMHCLECFLTPTRTRRRGVRRRRPRHEQLTPHSLIWPHPSGELGGLATGPHGTSSLEAMSASPSFELP